LDETQQADFDETQKKLREAAEKKATEQAEAAVTALKEKLEDPNYVKPTEEVSFADKVAAMKKANEARVQ
jgi:hypothetical protein